MIFMKMIFRKYIVVPNYSASSSDEDPYEASTYSDAEDFYEDNYDDFDGYEDAEDYYDEWGED